MSRTKPRILRILPLLSRTISDLSTTQCNFPDLLIILYSRSRNCSSLFSPHFNNAELIISMSSGYIISRYVIFPDVNSSCVYPY
uniref:Uncharacterized protein n=1 Tax=uncultured microorganism TaxID=358574 RepID=I2FJH2_9ZZZZ|nr:hypothetical protein [uncultured microorganism]